MINPTSIRFSDRWKSLLSAHTPSVHIVIILLLGIISYANTFDVPLQFDDIRTLRTSVGGISDLFSLHGLVGWPRWFGDVTFALNRSLHGERVHGYHLFNLAIHLSAACVIYLFVRRAIDALKDSFRISGDDHAQTFLQRFIPFATAALFVCHPIQTQAVTYIAQRYTSLATLLYLGSLLAYIKSRLSFRRSSRKLPGWLWATTSIVLALLAIKSKQIAFTLPFMVVVLEIGLFRGQLLKKRCFWLVATGLLLVIPILMAGTANPESLIRFIQSATVETDGISRVDYLLTQFRVVATYLRLLVLPVNQNLDYDFPVFHSLLEPSVISSLLLHIALAGLAIYPFIRSQRLLLSGSPTQGISLRLASLGIAWFYLALSVDSSVIPISDVINEHRLYLPSAGLFMSIAACIAVFSVQKQRYQRGVWSVLMLVCIVLAASTVARNRIWSDEMVLWQDVLEKSPNKARARHSVGTLYFKRFMPEKSLPLLVGAVELAPNDRKYWITLNGQISMLTEYRGRCSSGMEYHINSDTVDSRYRVPWIAISYNNLGLAYERLGKLTQARKSYRKAVETDPYLDLAWYNLALLAARQKDPSTVETALERLKAVNSRLEQEVGTAIREQAHSLQPAQH